MARKTPGNRSRKGRAAGRSSKTSSSRTVNSRAPLKKAFGVVAISHAFEGVDFPIKKRDLLRRAGHQRITYSKGKPVDLHRVILDLREGEFPSMANLTRAVSSAIKGQQLES
jgi:hypothetical protein